MGPHGAGYAMKLAANVGLGAYVQAIAESLALGAKQGLALDAMLDALSESATATGWLKAKTGVLKGEAGDMTLDIRTLRKDIMSAVATGALTGVPMPLSAGTLGVAVGRGRRRLRRGRHRRAAEIFPRRDAAEFLKLPCAECMSEQTAPAQQSAADVLAFWLAAGHERWFEHDEAFDTAIRDRFAAIYKDAAAGLLSAWENSPEGALALVIVLDQFPRNMFRGSARSFTADPLARAVARARHRQGLRPKGRHARACLFLPAVRTFGRAGGPGARRCADRCRPATPTC